MSALSNSISSSAFSLLSVRHLVQYFQTISPQSQVICETDEPNESPQIHDPGIGIEETSLATGAAMDIIDEDISDEEDESGVKTNEGDTNEHVHLNAFISTFEARGLQANACDPKSHKSSYREEKNQLQRFLSLLAPKQNCFGFKKALGEGFAAWLKKPPENSALNTNLSVHNRVPFERRKENNELESTVFLPAIFTSSEVPIAKSGNIDRTSDPSKYLRTFSSATWFSNIQRHIRRWSLHFERKKLSAQKVHLFGPESLLKSYQGNLNQLTIQVCCSVREQ